MCPDNTLSSSYYHTREFKNMVANRLYIIDFNSSKQFALGPGEQRAITLPPTQIPPPNDLRHFDPYSWDMYCVGRTLEWIVEVCHRFSISISARRLIFCVL